MKALVTLFPPCTSDYPRNTTNHSVHYTTNHSVQFIHHKLHTTNHRANIIHHKPQIIYHRSLITHHRSNYPQHSTADHPLHITDYLLDTINNTPQNSDTVRGGFLKILIDSKRRIFTPPPLQMQFISVISGDCILQFAANGNKTSITKIYLI